MYFFVLFNVKLFKASSIHDVRYFFENFWHFYSQSSFHSVQTAMEGPFHVTASHKPFPHEKKAPLLVESLWVQSLPHFPSFCLSSFPQLCHWLIHLKLQSLEQTDLGFSMLAMSTSHKQQLAHCSDDRILHLRFQVLCLSSFQIWDFLLPLCQGLGQYTPGTID